jgi:hypothetical protein
MVGKGARFLSHDAVLDGLAFRPYGIRTSELIAVLERHGVVVADPPTADKLRDLGRELLVANGLRPRGS